MKAAQQAPVTVSVKGLLLLVFRPHLRRLALQTSRYALRKPRRDIAA